MIIQASKENAKNYGCLNAQIELDESGERITATVSRVQNTLVYTFNRSLRLVRVARTDGAVVQAVKGVSFVRGLVRRELAERGLAKHRFVESAQQQDTSQDMPSAAPSRHFPAVPTPRKLRADLKNAFLILDNATTDDERTAARGLIERIKGEIVGRQSVAESALIAVEKQHDRMIRNVGHNLKDAASASVERGMVSDYVNKRGRQRLVRRKIAKFYADMDEQFPDPPAGTVKVDEALLEQIAAEIKTNVSPMVGNWKWAKGDVAIVAHKTKINRAILRSVIRTYSGNIAEMLGISDVLVSQARITLKR